MYEYIRGTLIEVTNVRAVVEARGIGYCLSIPAHYVGKLGKSGDEVLLYTSFIVREFAHTLFAFITKQERDLFEIVVTVSGIGPKTALALIGHFSYETLLQVIHSNNIVELAKVPGIGKKTAEKLVLELKGKLKNLLLLLPAKGVVGSVMQDALTALMNLGYNQARAEKAVERAKATLSGEADLAEIIAVALKSS